ncbi:MAG: type III restriction endonuclease subunit R [Gammaproteobacteria bacterium]|nr:MAG: type III restriction endonuclease subunit R [Gammaproteobacteria bacterium]
MKGHPSSLIINSPYRRPERHWSQEPDGTLKLVEGRRPASYELYDIRHNTRRVEALELVNRIRERVDGWREAGYPGITSITRRLLEHWHDASARPYPFYFCQLEAIETLIWHVEAPADWKQGIAIPNDGGPWERICNKMATGTGKTTLMAMIIAWQVLNALTYPKRRRDYSSAIFIVAPGLTVKERLHVLQPGAPDNYYDQFALCPSEVLRQRLNQAQILIENWHTLMPQKPPERSVVKIGPETDEAFTRRVLGPLAKCKGIAVINDEAHHAYRVRPELKISKRAAEAMGQDVEEATRWIEGLDRIHKTRGILRAFDLTATPFAPTGKASTEKGLFGWIVSDFGLNDAIEAGLVKTPRVVVRDDALPHAKSMRPKLYHLYREPEVAEDLNRRAEPHEPLPALVRNAYLLLGADWKATLKAWSKAGHPTPPVMLTVCNRTETAARIEHFLTHDIPIEALQKPEATLRVDSKVLEKAERGERASVDKAYEAHLRRIVEASHLPEGTKKRFLEMKGEELLRAIVDNVGKIDTPGQDLRAVISVAMLSEGWDAKNVTHIMGLRAFTSQLLCEQVIGRGLRRVAYERDEEGLFLPEYVNVFGVPLSIYQDVSDEGAAPPPPKPSAQIRALPERSAFEIRWPNILRVDTVLTPVLAVDWDAVPPLRLDPAQTAITADIAPALGGAARLDDVRTIDLEKLPDTFRLQRVIFDAARRAFLDMKGHFTGDPSFLIFQMVRHVETFLASDRLDIPSLYHQDPLRKRILITLNMDLVVQHLLQFLKEQNQESLEPVFDPEAPIGSTPSMRTWYTTKPCQPTQKSQISHVVEDSGWELFAANLLEKSPHVAAYAKNDHLGFHIDYLWKGSKRRYTPDFLIRLVNGKTLILEVKGQPTPQDEAKQRALALWVEAVNEKGGFGPWAAEVLDDPARLQDVLEWQVKTG